MAAFEFRRIPAHRMRTKHLSRFYEIVEVRNRKTQDIEKHKVSFFIDETGIAPYVIYQHNTKVTHLMSQKMAPVCDQGTIFDSYQDLMRAKWVKVRKVLKYDCETGKYKGHRRVD